MKLWRRLLKNKLVSWPVRPSIIWLLTVSPVPSLIISPSFLAHQTKYTHTHTHTHTHKCIYLNIFAYASPAPKRHKRLISIVWTFHGETSPWKGNTGADIQKTRCSQSHEDLAVGVGNITQIKSKENLGWPKYSLGFFHKMFWKAWTDILTNSI